MNTSIPDPMQQKPPQYLSNLRAATQNAHKELERITGSETVMNEITLNWYVKMLSVHLLHHSTIANHLKENHISTILDWPLCSRIPALQKDLEQLNEQAPDKPSFVQFPSKSYAFAIGLCYVSEGSCMGNQMMYKQFKRNEQFVLWGASSFFQECSKDWGVRWKAFMQIMHEVGSSDYKQLEKGALFGFQHFGELWKSRSSPSVHPS